MNEELAVLYRVQQADTEVARLKAALAGLDTGEGLEAEVAAGEEELTSLRAQLHATEQDSMDRNLELEALEEKKAKFESELYGGAVRNPRQLSDLQEEVQMLGREIGKVEDRVLELMEALEERRSDIGEREARLAETRERLTAVQQAHQRTGGRLEGEISELEARRRDLAAGVPTQLLKRYEQIRARQSNLGLVKVTGQTCPGCRITLPSEVLKGLKAGGSVQTCDNCGRLLFLDDSED